MKLYEVHYYTMNHGERINHTYILSARSAADACRLVRKAVQEMAGTPAFEVRAYLVK